MNESIIDSKLLQVIRPLNIFLVQTSYSRYPNSVNKISQFFTIDS